MNEVPPSPILVCTDDAVTYVVGNASHRERILTAKRIYGAARRGRITRHGGMTRGTARWDLRELDALLHRYDDRPYHDNQVYSPCPTAG